MTRKVLEGLATEESDVLLYMDTEGNLSLRSIVVRLSTQCSHLARAKLYQNLDRKPPTLIKSLPIARIQIPADHPCWSSCAQLVFSAANGSLLAFTNAVDGIQGHRLCMSDLISANPTGFSTLKKSQNEHETTAVNLQSTVHHFVRTPNGRGLLAVCEGGEIGVWSKEQVGKPVRGQAPRKSLAGKGYWKTETTPLQSAIFAKGRAVLLYSRPNDKPEITLQHLDKGCREPRSPVRLPDFTLNDGDEVAILLAVSDIDDGQSGPDRRTQRAVAMVVTQSGTAWCWSIISPIDGDVTLENQEPDIRLLHTYRLPVRGGSKPALVLPVDPMGWHTSVIDWKTDTPLQDMVLTISEDGVLEYWQPRLGQQRATSTDGDQTVNGASWHRDERDNKPQEVQAAWFRSGHVDTGRRNVTTARCSSRKKTVLGE
jgi:hypothetical protein